MRFLPAVLLLQGCSFFGADKATDPTERGLLYIASAIIVAAIIQALCNK